MYTTPLSPVMEEALVSIETNSITFLQANETTTIADYLSEKLIKSLLSGLKTLVVLPKSYDVDVPAKIMAKNKLAHLIAVWNNDDNQDNKAVERLKILSKLSEVNRPAFAYDMLQSYIAALTDEIDKEIQSYNSQVYNEKSYKDLVEYYRHYVPGHVSADLLKKVASIISPETIIDQIDDLERMYEARFDIMDCELFAPSVFSNKEDHIETRHVISSLYNYVTEIKHDFGFAKSESLQNIFNKVESESNTWAKVLSEAKDIYYTADIENDNFGEVLNNLLGPTKGFEYVVLESEFVDTLSWETLGNLIEKIDTLIANCEEIANECSAKYFKRLTPFNSSSERLRSVIHQMDELSSLLEESQWLNLTLSTQGLTLISIENEIIQIWKKLKLINTIFNDGKYVLFKLKQNALGLHDDVLHHLINNESADWRQSFVNLFISSFITNKNKKGHQKLAEKYEKLKSLIANKPSVIQDSVHNKCCKSRISAIKELKSTNEDLFNALFSATKTSLTLANIFYFDPTLVLSFYPIMIVTQDKLAELESFTTHWDNVIFYDSSIISVSSISPWKESNLDVSIITSKAINLNPIQDNWATELFFSKSNKLTYAQPFELLQTSDRYQQARALSLDILTIVPYFNVYRVKNKCIISLVSKSLNQKLIEVLDSADLNILSEQSNEAEALIEAMLSSESEIFILHENGLLNDQNTKSIEWQMRILQLLEEAQVNLINIDTLHLMNHCKATLHQIAKKLTNDYTSELKQSDPIMV